MKVLLLRVASGHEEREQGQDEGVLRVSPGQRQRRLGFEEGWETNEKGLTKMKKMVEEEHQDILLLEDQKK